MPKYYLLDENKNLVEVVNIEDNLFRTRLEKIHSEVNDTDHNIEFVTQAQYNQLVASGQLVGNTYYFITDDTTAEDLEDAIQGIIDGTTAVGHASLADNATNASNTDFTNAETKYYDYEYHQDDGYYALIPANEVKGEGYYWWQFTDARNRVYDLPIVHRFGGVYEIKVSPLFLLEVNNDLLHCFAEAQEQNDGSLKIKIQTERNGYVTRIEVDDGFFAVKKIR